MDGKIVKFDATQRGVQQVLKDVEGQDYESLIVIGYKGGDISIHPTQVESMTKLAGALEVAKFHMFETWE